MNVIMLIRWMSLFLTSLMATSPQSCPIELLFRHNNDFYWIDSSGNSQAFLLNLEGEIYPSASGKSFAVVMNEADKSQIVILDQQGHIEKILVVCSGRCTRIQWSPDETQLSYIDFHELDYRQEFYLINRDTAHSQKILDAHSLTSGFVDMVWSPDGQTIAYELLTPLVRREIFLYDLTEQTHQSLFPDANFEDKFYSLVGWRSGGEHLLFTISGHEPTGLYQIQINDGTIKHISPLFPTTMAESPNGEQIAFIMMYQHYEYIYIWDILTDDIQQLTQRGDIFFDAGGRLFWSPNEDKLYFSGLMTAYSIKINGEALTQITDKGRIVSFLACD